MKFAGLQKTSTVDFPGMLSAVAFAAGCNYRCFYCHNRQLIENPPLLEEGEVRRFFEKRAGLLDGAVLSGGEPTLQEDLYDFAVWLKKLGYQVKLDTNGSRPAVVERLLKNGLLDYAAVDYKAPFERYTELCGAGAEGVADTIRLLEKSGIDWELRTTLVPQIREQELMKMAQELPELPRYALQLYRMQTGDTRILKGLLPYTPQQIRFLAERVRKWQPNVVARC